MALHDAFPEGKPYAMHITEFRDGRAVERYFDLPEPKPGKTWSMLVYPGGRREIRQVDPEQITAKDEAIDQLKAGGRVYVGLGDAIEVVQALLLHNKKEDGNGIR